MHCTRTPSQQAGSSLTGRRGLLRRRCRLCVYTCSKVTSTEHNICLVTMLMCDCVSVFALQRTPQRADSVVAAHPRRSGHPDRRKHHSCMPADACHERAVTDSAHLFLSLRQVVEEAVGDYSKARGQYVVSREVIESGERRRFRCRGGCGFGGGGLVQCIQPRPVYYMYDTHYGCSSSSSNPLPIYT